MKNELRNMEGMNETAVCKQCNVNFKHFKSFTLHCKKKHPESPLPVRVGKPSKISCPTCKLPFSNQGDFIYHLKDAHSIDVETEVFEFDDLQSFTSWKEDIESETKARFVKVRGDRKSGKAHETTVLSCCRSGYFNSRGKGLRRLKTQGSRKVNGTCPAKMIVKNYEGKCKVVFTKTHYGHLSDIEHLDIAEKDRVSLAKKISAKIPFQAILSDIRESIFVEPSVGRKHLVSRKDLHNIEKSILCRVISGSTPSITTTRHDSPIDDSTTESYFHQPGIPHQVKENMDDRKKHFLKYIEELLASSNDEEFQIIENAVKLVIPTIEALRFIKIPCCSKENADQVQ